jgi:hypothetical protein
MGKERVGQDNVHEEKVVQRGKNAFADAGLGRESSFAKRIGKEGGLEKGT